MSRLLTLSVLAWLAAAAAVAAPAEGEERPHVAGALEVRVQNPLLLLFSRLGAAPMEIPEPGHGEVAWRSDYSSFFRLDERPGVDLVLLDGEIWRNTLSFRLGLGRDTALWAEIPTLHGGSGFLDHLIEEYHETFGFNQEGRDENPDDQFAFLLIHDRRLAYELPEDATDLGDVSLGVDWQVRRDTAGSPAVIVRAAVELPTGDDERGFGSGEVDGGLGVTLHEAWARYRLTGHVAYQLQQTPAAFRAAAVRTRDNWVADLALERGLGVDLAVILQLGYEESPIFGAALPASDDSSGTITLGASWRPARRWRLDLAFQEDFDGETSQDFTAHLALRRRF